MAVFKVDLTGDRELRAKIADLGTSLNRWMINRAFKPAAEAFRGPAIQNIQKRSGRLGAKSNFKVRAIKKARTMMGVALTSQFGSTDPANDPYYGAFVEWGHGWGRRPGKGHKDSRPRAKPVRYLKRSFEANVDRAGTIATTNLRAEIETAWQQGKASGSF